MQHNNIQIFCASVISMNLMDRAPDKSLFLLVLCVLTCARVLLRRLQEGASIIPRTRKGVSRSGYELKQLNSPRIF